MEKSRAERIKKYAELDDFFPLVVPNQDLCPWNLRKIDAYCREKGIDPSELTDEELKQFELKR